MHRKSLGQTGTGQVYNSTQIPEQHLVTGITGKNRLFCILDTETESMILNEFSGLLKELQLTSQPPEQPAPHPIQFSAAQATTRAAEIRTGYVIRTLIQITDDVIKYSKLHVEQVQQVVSLGTFHDIMLSIRVWTTENCIYNFFFFFTTNLNWQASG